MGGGGVVTGVIMVVMMGVEIVLMGGDASSVHGHGKDGIVQARSDEFRVGTQNFDHFVDVVTRVGVELCW